MTIEGARCSVIMKCNGWLRSEPTAQTTLHGWKGVIKLDVVEVEGGVTAPAGFRAAAVACGVKQEGLDVALLVSDAAATCAGMFTQNTVQAAPVLYSKQVVEAGQAVRAVVVNSGNANACTGARGLADAEHMATATARRLRIESGEVLVASTGVIGVPLPIDRIVRGLDTACRRLSADVLAGTQAAQAIMTTDTSVKQVAVKVDVNGTVVTIGGMAKGSGMIHPNMATMLSFVTTDASIAAPTLQRLLAETVQDTYQMISVDGDTSTNDMVLVLANGQAKAAELTEASPAFARFREAFRYVNEFLAKQIVRDGEGATKLIEVAVAGAASDADARRLVKTVITSSLVKTAFFGEDANWGRILAAMGRSGANFNPLAVSISFTSEGGSVVLMQDSEPVAFDENTAKQVLQPRDVHVDITLQDGSASALGWGCDLSYEYVRINGDYRT